MHVDPREKQRCRWIIWTASLKNSNDLLRDRAYHHKHAGGQQCREPRSSMVCPSFHARIKPVRAVSVLQRSSQPSGIRWWSSMRAVVAIKPPKPGLWMGFCGWHRSSAASGGCSQNKSLGFCHGPRNTLLLFCVINVIEIEMTIDEGAIQSNLAFLSLSLM